VESVATKTTKMKEYPLWDLTYKVIGLCMEVHRKLGHGFLEVVYKDAIEIEAMDNNISYARERIYNIHYKQRLLPHAFAADFVIDNKLIVKAAEGAIKNESIAQTLNYMKVSGCNVGLLINFGRESLEYKRLIL
jgi:GxxExxY protein